MEVKAEKDQAPPERMISMDEDFMIGYEGLDIDAITRDGKTVPVFRRGKWAF